MSDPFQEYLEPCPETGVPILSERVFQLDRESTAGVLRGVFRTGPVPFGIEHPSDKMLHRVQLMLLGFQIKANRMRSDETGAGTGMLSVDAGSLERFRTEILQEE